MGSGCQVSGEESSPSCHASLGKGGRSTVLRLLLVEDNARLRPALAAGLAATGAITVVGQTASGEDALDLGLETRPDAVLMDVQLAGPTDGIAAAMALRRELPRLPVIFYSIQDDDAYFRAFRRAGILTHYAYIRKSNYLLPEMLLPLLHDAVAGLGFVDPEIATRVEEVQRKDAGDPLALLEPNEQTVARLLAQGLSNEQIAARLGFRDKRTISRTNGQIYAAWGLAESTTDEKIARARAIIIMQAGRLLRWDDAGQTYALDERGEWQPRE
ncbi:MAG: response regulator transcription factor [Chloroflexi bacterium]|nr:response regulator transcription factor [Chloroflexota bacterium]